MCRDEPREKFKKAVRSVQKKMKPSGRPVMKKAARRSPSPENRCLNFKNLMYEHRAGRIEKVRTRTRTFGDSC